MRRSMGVVVVLSVAVLIAAGGIVVWGSGGAGAPSASAKPAASGLPARAPSVLDALPSTVSAAKLGSGGVDPASVRFIQSGTAGSYWAGLDARGDICLIVAAGPGSSVSGAGCASPAVFAAHGVSCRLTGTGGPVAEGYLIPGTVFPGTKASNAELAKVLDSPATTSYFDGLLLLDPAATKAQRDALKARLDGWFALDVLASAG